MVDTTHKIITIFIIFTSLVIGSVISGGSDDYLTSVGWCAGMGICCAFGYYNHYRLLDAKQPKNMGD